MNFLLFLCIYCWYLGMFLCINCMYLCMFYVYIVCIYVSIVCIYVSMYLLYAFMYLCIYCVYILYYLCMFICIYCMYLCMFLCIYVSTEYETHERTQNAKTLSWSVLDWNLLWNPAESLRLYLHEQLKSYNKNLLANNTLV